MRERRPQPEPTEIDQPSTHVSRRFSPAELDIDDLAEAVRLLLDKGTPARNLHLLSPRTRATHVMEAET